MPDFPEKILYEKFTCEGWNRRAGTRCKRRARYWMDGVTYCEEHLGDIPEMHRPLIRRIEYR